MLVIVSRASNICVAAFADEATDTAAQFPPTDFDRVTIPNVTLAPDDRPEKYMRNAQGQIVKRPLDELIALFDDERLKARLAVWRVRAQALPPGIPIELKLFLRDILIEVLR